MGGRVSMPQGRGSQLHNRREYEKIGKPIPDNIDITKSHENLTLVDRDIREVYEEIFGEALAAYNAKQKRADRKIENYYDHIQKSKNGEKLFYEDVVQWGSKENFDDAWTRQTAKEALMRYVITFEARNPNLRLIGAYIHMDEASPHLHLDYVPVAHGYTRGLETRNSLDKAMKEMGFQPEKESRKNNATKLWKEGERAYFADLCRGMGLEVEEERKARGSLSVEEYKEARDAMMGEIEKECQEEIEELNTFIEASQDVLAAYDDKIEERQVEYHELESTIDSKHEELAQVEERIRELGDLPRQNERLQKMYNRSEEKVAQLTEENHLLKRMLGQIKGAFKKLLSLGRGETEEQRMYAAAMEDYIGKRFVVDIKDLRNPPIEEHYKEKVKEREEELRLGKMRAEILRLQRQQEAREKQKAESEWEKK